MPLPVWTVVLQNQFLFSLLFQEKVEITKEEQALMKLIVDAYNRHQIPQDMAKKLVIALNITSIFTFFNLFLCCLLLLSPPATRTVQCGRKLPPIDRNGDKSSPSSGGVYKKYSRYCFLVCKSYRTHTFIVLTTLML